MALNRMISGAAAALLTMACAGSAMAQDRSASHPGEQMSLQQRVQMWDASEYARLQGAVEAHALCRGKLSESAMRAAVNTIEQQAGEPESPARKLAILDDAKWRVKSDILDNGCNTRRARQALAIFDARIAPGMHGGMMR